MKIVYAVAIFAATTNAAESETRLAGAKVTKLAHPTYVASLHLQGEAAAGLRCSGVLIEPKLVLTTATCASQNIEYVSVGRDAERRRVEKKSKHPNFFGLEHIRHDNLAILELVSAVPAKVATPIAIDRGDELDDDTDEVTDAIALGWFPERTGILARFRGQRSQGDLKLHEVATRIVPNHQCGEWWRDEFASNVICTAFDPRAARPNGLDEGCPLILQKRGGEVLVGIATFQFNLYDSSSKYPVVYSRISTYIPFIDDTIAKVAAVERRNIIDRLNSLQ
jgi:secreted trypsin-like serine protease